MGANQINGNGYGHVCTEL